MVFDADVECAMRAKVRDSLMTASDDGRLQNALVEVTSEQKAFGQIRPEQLLDSQQTSH